MSMETVGASLKPNSTLDNLFIAIPRKSDAVAILKSAIASCASSLLRHIHFRVSLIPHEIRSSMHKASFISPGDLIPGERSRNIETSFERANFREGEKVHEQGNCVRRASRLSAILRLNCFERCNFLIHNLFTSETAGQRNFVIKKVPVLRGQGSFTRKTRFLLFHSWRSSSSMQEKRGWFVRK